VCGRVGIAESGGFPLQVGKQYMVCSNLLLESIILILLYFYFDAGIILCFAPVKHMIRRLLGWIIIIWVVE